MNKWVKENQEWVQHMAMLDMSGVELQVDDIAIPNHEKVVMNKWVAKSILSEGAVKLLTSIYHVCDAEDIWENRNVWNENSDDASSERIMNEVETFLELPITDVEVVESFTNEK